MNSIMYKAIIKLIEKWGCMHHMRLIANYQHTDGFRSVFLCKKCGKVKKYKY